MDTNNLLMTGFGTYCRSDGGFNKYNKFWIYDYVPNQK